MSEGFRIHYNDQKHWGGIVLVMHPGIPGVRAPKEYVFRLDVNGDIIVSTTIWQRLQEIQASGLDHGFTFMNIVKNPPTINVSANDRSDQEKRIFRRTHTGISETEAAALQNIIPKGFKARGSR